MNAAVKRFPSPLRYPGGKGAMTPFLADVFQSQATNMDVEVWVEPFAGGAGAGLSLLARGAVDETWLVERNPALAAFWRHLVSEEGAEMTARVRGGEVPTLADFYDARALVHDVIDADTPVPDDDLREVAWATLVVNRCSRSGIIGDRKVGPIGGRAQAGRDTVASRWADSLADRLALVHGLRSSVRVMEGDGISYVEELAGSGIEEEVLVFADPPYVAEGPRLYSKSFGRGEHERLATALRTLPATPWMVTYDAHPEVLSLYDQECVMEFGIGYSAAGARCASEYAVCGPMLVLPGLRNPVREGLPVGWVSGREPWWA